MEYDVLGNSNWRIIRKFGRFILAILVYSRKSTSFAKLGDMLNASRNCTPCFAKEKSEKNRQSTNNGMGIRTSSGGNGISFLDIQTT